MSNCWWCSLTLKLGTVLFAGGRSEPPRSFGPLNLRRTNFAVAYSCRRKPWVASKACGTVGTMPHAATARIRYLVAEVPARSLQLKLARTMIASNADEHGYTGDGDHENGPDGRLM